MLPLLFARTLTLAVVGYTFVACARDHARPLAVGLEENAGQVLPGLVLRGGERQGRPFSQRDGQWRWSWPTPHGHALRGVWVAGSDEAWAVGARGTIVRFHGGVEKVVPSGTEADLKAIWGSSRTDLWVVGERGTILHGDGKTWTAIPSPVPDTLEAVWGSGPHDIWAVGHTRAPEVDGSGEVGTGTILRGDGRRFLVVARNVDRPFRTVWGSGPDDVYVGGYGPVWHFDGRGWSTFALGTLSEMTILGSGREDVWVLGRDHLLARWDGKAWSLRDHPDGPQVAEAAASARPGEFWATSFDGVWRYTAAQWSRAGAPLDGQHFWGAGARPEGAVWLVGGSGGAAQWDGRSWKVRRRAEVRVSERLWVPRRGDPWVFSSDGEARRWSRSAWVRDDTLLSGLSAKKPIRALWGASAERLWVVAEGEVWSRDGRGWRLRHRGEDFVGDVAGVRSDQAWVVGKPPRRRWDETPRGLLLVWNGETIVRHELADPPHQTAGADVNDIWALGRTMRHWDGRKWQERTDVPPGKLHTLCSNGRDDVWAAGEKGLVMRWDGRKWRTVSTPVGTNLIRIWCGGPDDVWAVGEEGTVIAWDGRSFRPTPSGTNYPLDEVGGNSGGLWATGWGGIVLRFE